MKTPAKTSHNSSNKKTAYVAKDGTRVHLTKRQKHYADAKLDNPDLALSKIAARAYPRANPDTLRQIVNMNEKNKDIAIYSNEQYDDAKRFIHSVVNNQEDKTRDRLTAAIRIEDRVLGTPTQQIQHVTTGVTLHIDLSTALELDAPATPLDQPATPLD